MPEPVLVADSSPLIGLARIRQLDLIRRIALRVLVPPAVRAEVAAQGEDAPGAREVAAADWIEVEAPDPLRVEPLRIFVNQGEAEAIALAQGLPGAVVLLDDSRARRLAERLRLSRLGTLGVLRRAKQEGMIPAIKPLVEALQQNGIYVRQALVEAILRDVGEWP